MKTWSVAIVRRTLLGILDDRNGENTENSNKVNAADTINLDND